jgi:hypothetical protein
MESSIPVMALTFLGILIAVLALFAGGGIELILVGLGAIAVAGILQVLGSRRN